MPLGKRGERDQQRYRVRPHWPLATVAPLALFSSSLGAQTVRGTVIDDVSKLPIYSAAVTLLDDTGAEIRPGARTDSLGTFALHASRAGQWRVKAMRIGYGPVTSEAVTLPIGGLAVVRLRMTTVAQQLLPVQVIEQRQLSANELMSTAGFDLRESRGLGRFLSGDRLAAMGRDNVRDVLAIYFQPALYVYSDSVMGEVLHMRQAAGECAPEVFLDGRLLATAPPPAAVADGPPPLTAIDSMRAQMRFDSERLRLGAAQMYALQVLSSLTADALHGIEVYRANETPPTSLGAWFGMTKASISPCGAVAVWTKAGARSVVAARSPVSNTRAVQVISGTLLDYDTGKPLAGRSVSLLTDARDAIGTPAITDEHGDFTFRTPRFGELRLTSGGDGYLTSTTPTFRIATNEMVIVKLFVSGRQGVLAPLGVAARVLPQQIGLTSLAGFTYRRERAQGGTFLRAEDIERAGAQSIVDLLRSAELPAGCTPTYYLDGNRLSAKPELVLSSVFGTEIYTRESEVPELFAETGACAIVVIWTKR